MNEQEIARHAEQVENYRNHVFGKESNQLFAEVDMWIKGDKSLKKIREIFSDAKKPRVPTKSIMGYYDVNEGDEAKQAVVSYRDKHRQNLSANKQLGVIGEQEIKEFDQTIDQFEKKIVKLQETVSANYDAYGVASAEANHLLFCPYCKNNRTDEYKDFLKKIKDVEKETTLKWKESKVELFATIYEQILLQQRFTKQSKISKQRKFEEDCKKYLDGARTLPQLKKFLKEWFNYRDDSLTSHKGKIYIPSRGLNEFLFDDINRLSIDQQGNIWYYEKQTIFNLTDIDLIENIFDIEFKK